MKKVYVNVRTFSLFSTVNDLGKALHTFVGMLSLQILLISHNPYCKIKLNSLTKYSHNNCEIEFHFVLSWSNSIIHVIHVPWRQYVCICENDLHINFLNLDKNTSKSSCYFSCHNLMRIYTCKWCVSMIGLSLEYLHFL